MTCREYALLFRPHVRVRLDWERVQAADWPVETLVADTREQVERWFFPWYAGPANEEVSYDSRGARPLPVAEWELGGSYQGEHLDEVVDELRAMAPPVQLLLATYALPEDRQLVLDGNHRLVAVLSANIPFAALGVSLHGPIDPDVLPDLRHWTSPSQPSSR